MSDSEKFDLEASTAQAWRGFQAQLADHLAEMVSDDLLIVTAESAVGEDAQGASPYVQYCAWGERMLRCEVVSNHHLAAQVALDAAGEQALCDLGFAAPTYAPDGEADSGSVNFYVDVEQTDADRLAVMGARALREVFGVVDPAFLDSDLSEDDEEWEGPPGEADCPHRPVLRDPAAVYPQGGHEELQSLVDEALASYCVNAAEHDEDGDLPVFCGGNLIFARVDRDIPVVRLFSWVVCEVKDTERAALEVGILNRESLFFTFLVSGRSVMIRCHLPAWPFAADHLTAMVELMGETIDKVEGDLAARLGATMAQYSRSSTEDDDAEDDDEVANDEDAPRHSALETLLELEAGCPGRVDPAVAAAICDHDRRLILDLLDWHAQHRTELLAAREAADLLQKQDQRIEAEEGLTRTERLTRVLRDALWLTVEGEADSASRDSRYGGSS